MTLTREQAFLVAGVFIGVVLAFCLSPMSPLAKQAAVGTGWEGTTWSPQQPRVGHYAQGGLYHPAVCGEGRTNLLRHGWDWIATPPSEVTVPGVTDA